MASTASHPDSQGSWPAEKWVVQDGLVRQRKSHFRQSRSSSPSYWYFEMTNVRTAAFAFFASTFSLSCLGAGAVNRCSTNGSVTFQSEPCPTGGAKRARTVEQLNAEQQKKSRLLGERDPTGGGVVPNARQAPQAAAAQAPQVFSFKCDGRTYCSQMTSCSEATYFLSHCPDVKMDGDGDGIPCEEQWCSR